MIKIINKTKYELKDLVYSATKYGEEVDIHHWVEVVFHHIIKEAKFKKTLPSGEFVYIVYLEDVGVVEVVVKECYSVTYFARNLTLYTPDRTLKAVELEVVEYE